MRKIYRNEYDGLTCNQIHKLYFKLAHNDKLQKQKIEDVECYKGISHVL